MLTFDFGCEAHIFTGFKDLNAGNGNECGLKYFSNVGVTW